MLVWCAFGTLEGGGKAIRQEVRRMATTPVSLMLSPPLRLPTSAPNLLRIFEAGWEVGGGCWGWGEREEGKDM